MALGHQPSLMECVAIDEVGGQCRWVVLGERDARHTRLRVAPTEDQIVRRRLKDRRRGRCFLDLQVKAKARKRQVPR